MKRDVFCSSKHDDNRLRYSKKLSVIFSETHQCGYEKNDCQTDLGEFLIGTAQLQVLKGVPNDSLELEIKFQGGAHFDPAAWSQV